MNRKLLVMADLQIGMMPEGRPELAEDFINAGKWACELASKTPGCTGIAVAGDMRDTPQMPGEQFGWLMDILESCGDIPMAVLCGNHDMTTPNWVKTATRRINGIYDLTTPEGIEAIGLKPEEAFGLDYQNPAELERILRDRLASGTTRTLFLHQAFGEFGASRFADIHLETIRKLVPQGSPLTIFSGDIHNYGDAKTQDNEIRVYSPGSLQMTDVNEGFNGLPSKQYDKMDGADAKYILWYDLDTGEVTRQAVPPHILRPWRYLKLKDGIKNIPEILAQAGMEWIGRPKGIIELKVPSADLTRARAVLNENPGLSSPFDRVRIRILPDPKTAEKLDAQEAGTAPDEITKRQNWVSNELLALAEEEVNAGRMQGEALDLLKCLCESKADGKRAVQLAVHAWNKGRLKLGEISLEENKSPETIKETEPQLTDA